MPASDLVQRVTKRIEEVLVGGEDGAVEIEFDDGLGSFKSCSLAVSS